MRRDNNVQLLKAVELLEEALDKVNRLKVSKSSQSSARALLIKVRKARDLVMTELARPEPRLRQVAALLVKAAKWLAELLINNIQCLLDPKGYVVHRSWESALHSSTIVCVPVLSKRTLRAEWEPLRPICLCLSPARVVSQLIFSPASLTY